MLFNSEVFVLGFLPAALLGFAAAERMGGRVAAKIFVLAASLFFYGWWNPVFLVLLAGSIVVNYWFGQKLPSKPWLVAGLVFNLALLAYFKYRYFVLGFFGAGLPPGGVLLPLGISFFTFQQVMFLVDRDRGEIFATGFLDYACCIAFFPHLIAGPIVRPKHIIPQFAGLRPAAPWAGRLAAGAELFLLGLAKKSVLADGLARFADPGFAAAALHERLTLIEAWVALLAYGLQIYFDFSGYSDMAIGLARMFGIHFPPNFASPYQARNISEFWRRWNMSLSHFLRDYLYIPLGGNRRGEARRVANLMVTMLLGGLWHGAAWRFVLWGALHGAFLVIHGWFSRLGVWLPGVLARGITLLAVLLAWVPFRCADIGGTIDMYRGLAGLNGVAIPAVIAQFWPWARRFGQIVPVLPYLGDVRTLSLPEGFLWLAVGWFLVLALPNTQEMGARSRGLAVVGSFAFSVQALFFAPFAAPFLYFQF